MAALTIGAEAPEFTLPSAARQTFSLFQALQQGPAVLVFLKTNCPVCRYAFPFLERLHASYREQRVTVLAASQSSGQDTARFREEYRISFLTALDDPNGYLVSNAYGITNTPTEFLIADSGTITISSVGWSRADVAAINAKIAEWVASTEIVFHAGENIAEWKPG